jgi:hypothetical protein
MTSSTPPTGIPVRQQLDELDALLQRMLALPMNQAPAGSPITETRMAEPTPTLQDGWKQPAMTLLNDSGPVPQPKTVEQARWDPSWGINLNPQNGSSILGSRSPAASVHTQTIPAESPSRAWRSEPVIEAAPTAESLHPATPDPAPPIIAMPEPPFRPRPSSRRPPPSFLAAPFETLNRTFDAVVGIVPFGSSLTTPLGKNLVGFAGILMLLVGFAWGALEYFGWPH